MAVTGEYSEVAIFNLALQALGRSLRVTAVDEDSNAARTMLLRYPYARDATLRDYEWNFASARASLPSTTAPAFEFANAFDLPADCLKVREVFGGNKYDWKIEGRQILTNLAAPLLIKYTRRVTNVGEMAPDFVTALATRMASECAVSLAESSEKAGNLWQAYTALLIGARGADAQEGQAEQLPQGSWVDAREMGGGYVEPYSDWNPNA